MLAVAIVAAGFLTTHFQGPPLYGFRKGETLFSGSLTVGGDAVKTGIKGDGTTNYIVHFSGIGTTPGGRQSDALYNFANPNPAGALPMKSTMVRLLIGNTNYYSDFIFWAPIVTDTYPTYKDDHEYDFLWRPSPGDEISVAAPATKWTSPTEDVLTGSYQISIYRAVQGDEKSSGSATFQAVDCLDFQRLRAPRFPAMTEPENIWLDQMANNYQPIKGVAADGVSLVLLRAITDMPGKATFTLSMRSSAKNYGAGAFFPLVGDPFKSAGNSSIEVQTKRLADKKYCAFALYRPPIAFGVGDDRDLTFTVQFKNEDGSDGAKQDLNLKLVRPPVILVHGTYDEPVACYKQIEEIDDSDQSMYDWLQTFQFHRDRIFCLDWKEWNGSKDPSDFVTNEKRVWDGKEGIREALESMRSKGIACTQADLVCHSQGGAIARVYARGYSLQRPPVRLPTDHPHFHDPNKCMEMGCWYHRIDNYAAGDIHRLITISTTHRGSAVCNLFVAFDEYVKEKGGGDQLEKTRAALVGYFRNFVDKNISGVTTGGFYAQVPGSEQLKALGPTPVASHAIACCCSNEEMRFTRPDNFWVAYGLTRGLGNYLGKMFLVRSLTPVDAQIYAFHKIADYAQDDPHLTAATKNKLPQLADRFEKLAREYQQGPNDEEKNAEIIFLIRQIVFQDDENDCTVAVHSSYGGLEAPYITKVDHTLHGWAPRSKSVQNKVLDVLCDGGGLLDPNGFPDSYYGGQSEAKLFVTPPIGGSFTPPPSDNGANHGAAGSSAEDSKIAAAVVGQWDHDFAIPPGSSGPGYLHVNADGTMAWQTTGESGTWKASNGRILFTWKKDGVVDTLSLIGDGKILDGSSSQGFKVRLVRSVHSGGEEEEPPHIPSGASAKYAGEFQTDFGKMTITISNGSVKGSIEGGKGDFHGTITGSNIAFSGTIIGTACTGEIEFSSDGKSFKGFYIDPDGPTKIVFTGDRLKDLGPVGPLLGIDSGNHLVLEVVLGIR